MTKTNEKYTYEDFLLKKRILKQEIKDIEKSVSIENLPNVLKTVTGNIKDKAMGFMQNPNILNLAIDTGIGLGTEKVLSKFINKKSFAGKITLLAASYLIPLAISKTKKFLSSKKKKQKLI